MVAMHTFATFLGRCSTLCVCACLLLLSNQSWSAKPTLARLSFWVAPERMTEFETAYEQRIVPILKKHGLAESVDRGRATIDSVFSRLYAFNTASKVVDTRLALEGDPMWKGALRVLWKSFGIAGGQDDIIRHRFGVYTTQSGPGKVVSAEGGRGHWHTYDVADELGTGGVASILQDREGYLWFGTLGGGAGRYDGQTWIRFTTQDGLADDTVYSIFQDREGYLWFGTRGGGVSRYDPRVKPPSTSLGTGFAGSSASSGQAVWTTYTIQDGLAHNTVASIFQDREGFLWFGTRGGGVSRYDPRVKPPSTSLGTGFAGSSATSAQAAWTTYTIQDGLAHNTVASIFQDREGHLWFGTWRGGVSRYDGETWTTYTTQDGLANNGVRAVLQDREGHFWFGTRGGGVSRFDGKTWTTFTTQDGLGHNAVRGIVQDEEGRFWFGTWGGVSRYDPRVKPPSTSLGTGFAGSSAGSPGAGTSGKAGQPAWTTFNVHNDVWTIEQDREGHLWVGAGDGVSRYDGQAWTTFTAQDGLAHDQLTSIVQDREGHLWFATVVGVSRYDGQT